MQGWFLNTLFSALKIALKLFSIYLSSTSHFRIAWSIALRAPSLFFFFFFLLTGCLLTPSQFFQTRTRSWRNWEAILQTPQTRISLFSFTPQKKNWSNLLCVNASKAFSRHSFRDGWGKKPTDFLSHRSSFPVQGLV